MSIYYSNYPKATIRYDVSYLSYVIISYTGNTTTTSNSIVSNNISTNYYITPELSFNTLYTFTITPYDNSGISGVISTFTMDTTPKISGVKATNSNTANTTLQWKGITSYSYVKISRGTVIGISAEPIISTYTDISSVVLSSPYYDTDLSGNTTYSYKITPYTKGVAGSTSNDISIYKNVMSATDLSATFFDTSAIRISFTPSTNNNYNTSQNFTLRTYNTNTTTTLDISGTTSPLLITDLSDGTTYTCSILTTLDNIYIGTSASISVELPPLIINYLDRYTNISTSYTTETYLVKNTTYASRGISNPSVSSDQLKIIGTAYGGIVYMLNYNEGEINKCTTISYIVPPQGLTSNEINGSIRLSADGKRGAAGGNFNYDSGYFFTINWINDIPTMVISDDTEKRMYWSISMTPTGDKLVCCAEKASNNLTTLWFTTYNTTTNKYNPLTSTQIPFGYRPIRSLSITPDGNTFVMSLGSTLYYSLWNNTINNFSTPIAITTNSAYSYILNENSYMYFLGGGNIYDPTYLLISTLLFQWNQTTKTISNLPVITLPFSGDFPNISTSNGYNLYYNSNTHIYRCILSATPISTIPKSPQLEIISLTDTIIKLKFISTASSKIPIISYKLIIKNSSNQVLQTISSSTRINTISNLTTETTYYITGSIITGGGSSPSSTILTVITHPTENFILQSFTNISAISLTTTAFYTSSTAIGSVRMNTTKTKLIYISSTGLFYTTFSNNAWATPIQIGSGYSIDTLQMSSDLTKGFGYQINGSSLYYINWIGTTPTVSLFYTTVYQLNASTITPNGDTFIIQYRYSTFYFTKFNYTTNTYATLQQIPSISLSCFYGAAISPDGSYFVFYSDSGLYGVQAGLYYSEWMGTNYSPAYPIDTVNLAGPLSMWFAGGGNTGTPTYLCVNQANNGFFSGGYGGVGFYYTKWDYSTKSIGTIIKYNDRHQINIDGKTLFNIDSTNSNKTLDIYTFTTS